MNIVCDCGAFRASLLSFPRNTPGRLVCYCRDCQTDLGRIGRSDILDKFGGTEVIPAYPGEVKIISGIDRLKCRRLTSAGLDRWVASCCNSPIVNTKAGFPWAGFFRTAFSVESSDGLKALGEIRSRVHGRHAIAGAPSRMSRSIGFRDMLVVMPFIVKGKLLNKSRNSLFYGSDNVTPTCEPAILEQ